MYFLESDDSKNLIAISPKCLKLNDQETCNGTEVNPISDPTLQIKPQSNVFVQPNSMINPELEQVGLFHCGETINRLVTSPICRSILTSHKSTSSNSRFRQNRFKTQKLNK